MFLQRKIENRDLWFVLLSLLDDKPAGQAAALPPLGRVESARARERLRHCTALLKFEDKNGCRSDAKESSYEDTAVLHGHGDGAQPERSYCPLNGDAGQTCLGWCPVAELQTRSPAFGMVAGTCEIGAVIAALLLVVASRNRPKVFRWTVLAAACLAATHAISWMWVAPVNAALVPLSAETLPPDWTRLRDPWE